MIARRLRAPRRACSRRAIAPPFERRKWLDSGHEGSPSDHDGSVPPLTPVIVTSPTSAQTATALTNSRAILLRVALPAGPTRARDAAPVSKCLGSAGVGRRQSEPAERLAFGIPRTSGHLSLHGRVVRPEIWTWVD